MTIYLHNNCDKVTKKLREGYQNITVNKRGVLYLNIGWHAIRILRCPYCGRTGKRVLKYETK